MTTFDSIGIMIDSGKCGLPGGARAVVDEAVWAEQTGFHSVWVGESRLTVDAMVPITLIAGATERIKVGSGVLPYRTRNVALLALSFKTLEILAPGRIRLGLGAWWEPIASQTGLPNNKPLTAMREVLTVVKGLLAGDTVSLEGEFVKVRDIRLDGLGDDDGGAYPIPLYIGAVREKMVRLAGELADGVLLDFLVPPSYTVAATAQAHDAARQAGRDPATFELPQLVAFAADDVDPDSAVDTCRYFLTQYIAQQPHITEHCGAEPDVIERVKSEAGWPATRNEIRNAMRHVPDSLVHSVAACGTVNRALDKIGEWIDAGCTEPVLTALGDRPIEALSALAQRAQVHHD